MANQFDELLTRILAEDSVTVIIYNQQHYANLRSGLSKAKARLQVMREMLGDESLETTRFTYTTDKVDSHKVTISTVKGSPAFKIIYADKEEPP